MENDTFSLQIKNSLALSRALKLLAKLIGQYKIQQMLRLELKNPTARQLREQVLNVPLMSARSSTLHVVGNACIG